MKKVLMKIAILVVGIFVIALLPISSDTGASIVLVFFCGCCIWIIVPLYRSLKAKKEAREREKERIAREEAEQARKVREEKMKRAADELLSKSVVVFDTETTGLKAGKDELTLHTAKAVGFLLH